MQKPAQDSIEQNDVFRLAITAVVGFAVGFIYGLARFLVALVRG